MKLQLVMVLILAGCAAPVPNVDTHEEPVPVLVMQESASTASLRGLSVLSDSTAWASGTNGTYLRTTDGGESWEIGTVPGAEDLDFRDVEGMDAERAFLLSAGEPAKLFETTDGGAHWGEIYSNDTPGIFFDSMAFWDGNTGIAFSDPVEGNFVIIRTTDGGITWEQTPPENLPPSHDGEAANAVGSDPIPNAWGPGVAYCIRA